MRVLVDTNILIHREENHVVPENLQHLLRNLGALGISPIIHPGSLRELDRIPDLERMVISKSKVMSYPVLEPPPDPQSDNEYLKRAGPLHSENDEFDVALLYALYKDAVDFLLTEDLGIHKRAKRMKLEERVLTVDDALLTFKTQSSSAIADLLPAVKEVPVYNIDYGEDILSPLKDEYPKFSEWWKKISAEGRKAFVAYQSDGSISALLITKIEHDSVASTPPIVTDNILKICTFIAQRTGQKIGELFVKESIRICLEKHIDQIYLTHFTRDEDYLVKLISNFGFSKHSEIGEEDVYLKHLTPNPDDTELTPSRISRIYYPSFYDGPKVKKLIVPIIPQYHERLFTDYYGRQTKIVEHLGEFITEGNTIDKVYLSHSPIRLIEVGDLLFFYRSGDMKQLTSIGVVQRVFVSQNPSDILSKVGKRSVYSVEEIRNLSERATLVILFRWHFHLPEPIGLQDLKELGVLRQAPQSITQIEHGDYLKILKRSQMDERYTIHKT